MQIWSSCDPTCLPSYDSSFDAVKIKIRQNVPLNFCVYSFTVASDKSEHFVFFRRRRQCDQIIDISYTWTAYWPRQTAFVDSSSYVAYHHITCFSAICRACVLMPLHAVSWLLYSDLPTNYFFKFYGPDVGIKSSPILLKFYSKSWQVFWLLLSTKPFKIVQSGNTVFGYFDSAVDAVSCGSILKLQNVWSIDERKNNKPPSSINIFTLNYSWIMELFSIRKWRLISRYRVVPQIC